MVSVPIRPARERCEVRSGVGLGEPLTPVGLAAEDRRQEPLLLLLGAVLKDRRGDEREAPGDVAEGAPSDASSWLNTYCCSRLKPAPPCSLGQPRAAQPFSTSFACHVVMVGRSMGIPRRKRSRTSAGRLARMKARTSARNAARSGWKSKFTCRCRPAAGRRIRVRITPYGFPLPAFAGTGSAE